MAPAGLRERFARAETQAGLPKLDEQRRATLRKLVEEDNDAMLAELLQRRNERTGVKQAISAVHEAIVKGGPPEKTSPRRSASVRPGIFLKSAHLPGETVNWDSLGE